LVTKQQIEAWKTAAAKGSQLEQQVGSLNQTVQAITGERDAAQGQLTELNTQVANFQSQLSAATGATEAANQARAQLEAWRQQNEPQIGLVNMIASDPKYHSLIGSVNAIRVDPDPAKQKEILDALAGTQAAQTQTAIEQYRTGSTPPGGGGTPTQPVRDPREIWPEAFKGRQLPERFDMPESKDEAFQLLYRNVGVDSNLAEIYTSIAENWKEPAQPA
jgi:hypothetical protein